MTMLRNTSGQALAGYAETSMVLDGLEPPTATISYYTLLDLC